MPPIPIKLDVEGHELAVLQGAEQVLADPRLWAVILETNGSGKRYVVDDMVLFEVMARCSFQPIAYDTFNRRLFSGKLSWKHEFLFLIAKRLNGACKRKENITWSTAPSKLASSCEANAVLGRCPGNKLPLSQNC